jgi:hypothetical protein
MAEYGFMGCGAVESKKSNQLRNGMMFCGAKPTVTKPGDVSSEYEIVDQEAQKLITEIEGASEAEVIRVPALPEKNAEEAKPISTVPNKDWHVLTLKKLALEKGYEGTAFDKKSLLEFLDANK